MADSKVLILGGTGFIGRNLVAFLIENNLSSKIVVVDKTHPQLAWLNEKHAAFFANEKVEFRSANLINLTSAANAMQGDFDYIINLAAETRFGQFEQVYEEGIYKLGINCAKLAVRGSLKRYVEVSTVMNSSESPVKEDCKRVPVSPIGKSKSRVEKELPNIKGLPYTILRLPVVYGSGDRTGLTPRFVIAAVYKYLQQTMKLLWTKDLKINTVHVDDVCAAIWFLATQPKTENQIINVVDDSNTTQGTLSTLLCEIFNIEVDYLGSILSKLAKIDISAAVKEINEDHLQPWAKLCREKGIENTPLSPYIDAELLQEHHICLSNEKLKSFGFEFKHSIVTKALIEDVIREYIEQKLFPKVI